MVGIRSRAGVAPSPWGSPAAPSGFSVERADDFTAMPGRHLFDLAEAASFDLGLDWFRHLAATALPPASEACCYLLRDNPGAQPVAILPLRRERAQKRLYALANFYTTRYAPLLRSDLAEPALAALFAAIRDEDAYSSLTLFPLAAEQPLFAATTRALRLAGWLPFEYFCFGNWYLPLAGQSYAEYFATLPARLRHTLQRKGRQFHGQARGRLDIVTGGEPLEAAIAAFEQLYRARWGKTEPYPLFIPGLVRMYAGKSQLRLGLAYVDERPAAAQVWLVSQGRAAIYKLASAPEQAHLSVGSLLTNHLMQHVIDVDRVHEIDYLIGDEPYKRDWMRQRRERWGIVAYNPRSWRGLAGAADEMARRAAKAAWSPLGRACAGMRNRFRQQDDEHADP